MQNINGTTFFKNNNNVKFQFLMNITLEENDERIMSGFIGEIDITNRTVESIKSNHINFMLENGKTSRLDMPKVRDTWTNETNDFVTIVETESSGSLSSDRRYLSIMTYTTNDSETITLEILSKYVPEEYMQIIDRIIFNKTNEHII